MPYPLLLHAKHHPQTMYQPFGEWVVPWRSQSVEAEYHTLRTGVGLTDYSTRALIEVGGADRVDFLHRLLTNDIRRLAPGTGCQAALLTDTAKLVADLVVLADEDTLWLLCDATRADIVMQTLERYHFAEEVALTNHERQTATLAIHGPRTFEFLTRILGAVLSLPHPEEHARITLQEIPARLVRHTLTGEAGLLLLCPAEHAHTVWDWLRRRGVECGLGLVGWEALNVARIEAGIPWFGIDMNETNLLPETGLEAVAASDTKGCYLGQEIIARMATYGSANKKLMGVLLEGEDTPERDDPMVRDGQVVGRVTSACFSLALHRPIAMGYLLRGAYDAGTSVEIMRGERRLAATVTSRPFIALT